MYRFIKGDTVLRQESITLKDIEEIEDTFMIRFPNSIKNFLLQYNGVEMELSIITVNSVQYEVSKFIPIKHGRLPVEKIMEWDKLDGILPTTLIPVASDRGGNIFYCNPNNNNIVFYNSEDIENPVVISHSFEEFLENLDPVKL